MLARREYSRAEVIQQLLTKSILAREHADIAEEVVAECVSEGWISDERFVEAFVRAKRNRGAGPHKILHELQQKGVDSDLAESWVYAEDNDWRQAAFHQLQKRYCVSEIEDIKVRAKATRYLLSKGYNNEQIRAAMSMMTSPCEE